MHGAIVGVVAGGARGVAARGVQTGERLLLVTGGAGGWLAGAGRSLPWAASVGAVAGGAAGGKREVGIVGVLGLVAVGAGLHRGARMIAVRLVAARAGGVTWGSALVLGNVTRAAGGRLRALVWLVAGGAGFVLGGGVALRSVATGAVAAAALGMMRQALVAVRAGGVARVLVRQLVLVLVAGAAECGLRHTGDEGVGLVAIGASEVLPTVAVILSHGAVAAGAGLWTRRRAAGGVRCVAGDAGGERSLLRGVVGVSVRVAAVAGALRVLLDVVGVVAARARSVGRGRGGREGFVPSVAAFARSSRCATQVVAIVTTHTAFVTASEGGRIGYERWLLPMAAQAGAPHVRRGTVRRVAVQALLVDGAIVAEVAAMTQVHALVTGQARLRFETLLAMRLVAIGASLIGVYDHGGMSPLGFLMTIDALGRFTEEEPSGVRIDLESQGIDRRVSLEDVTRGASLTVACGAVVQGLHAVATVAGSVGRHGKVPDAHAVARVASEATPEVRLVAGAQACRRPRGSDLRRGRSCRLAALASRYQARHGRQRKNEHVATEPVDAQARGRGIPRGVCHGQPRQGHQAGVAVSNGVA